MATMTNEQIEQKKQLLAEKEEQMKSITNELKEAGALELAEDDLDKVSGGILIREDQEADRVHPERSNSPI